MFGSFGMLEILIILVVGVVVFGVVKLPRFARSVGAGWQELKLLKKGLGMGLDEDEPSKDERSNRREQRFPGSQTYYQQGPEQQYYGQGPAQQWSQGHGQAAPPEGWSPSPREGGGNKPPEDLKNT